MQLGRSANAAHELDNLLTDELIFQLSPLASLRGSHCQHAQRLLLVRTHFPHPSVIFVRTTDKILHSGVRRA